MRPTRAPAFCVVLLARTCLAAEPSPPQSLDVVISQHSVRINGVELRSGPPAGIRRYISLESAEKVLGPPQDTYLAGLGVRVYAWCDAGIHVQRGFRGSDKGKIFKFQVWFDDSYDKTENKHSGKFKGRLRVEELDIGPETTFDSIRGELQKAGYEITEYPDVISAKKGGITIFTLDATNRIQRVETWCGF